MTRATGWLGCIALLCVALCAQPAACASDDCASGPAGELVRRSTFAHGYLHGYESGFQTGDVDFHTAQIRDPRRTHEFEKTMGYEPGFGSRSSFTAGYRRGFIAGYQDSVSGRDFRGFAILSTAEVGSTEQPADFDQGFRDGYKAGDGAGAAALDADSDFDPGQGVCPAKPGSDGRLPPSSQAYCAGYRSAYRLGYTDGFVFTPPSQRGAVVAAK